MKPETVIAKFLSNLTLSRIIFGFFFAIVLLAGLYTSYGIAHFKMMAHSVHKSPAAFLMSEGKQISSNPDQIVYFMAYDCGFCKTLKPILDEVRQERPDIDLLTRPLVFGEDKSQRLTRIVIAAGLQDNFDVMHGAIMDYPESDVPDSFIEETAMLYGLDYQKLLKDAQGKQVEKIAEANMKAAQFAAIDMIPTFFIDNVIYIIDENNFPTAQDILASLPPKR